MVSTDAASKSIEPFSYRNVLDLSAISYRSKPSIIGQMDFDLSKSLNNHLNFLKLDADFDGTTSVNNKTGYISHGEQNLLVSF